MNKNISGSLFDKSLDEYIRDEKKANRKKNQHKKKGKRQQRIKKYNPHNKRPFRSKQHHLVRPTAAPGRPKLTVQTSDSKTNLRKMILNNNKKNAEPAKSKRRG